MTRARGASPLILILTACNVAPTFELLTPPNGVDASAIENPIDGGVRPDSGHSTEPLLTDGQPCARDNQCEHAKCMPDPAFPQGYCTKQNCTRDNQCSTANDVCAKRAGPDICANKCTADSECRMGYACFAPTDGEDKVCLPASQKPVEKKFDGESCRRNADCKSNTCMPSPDWPDGSCTHQNCGVQDECSIGMHDTDCINSQIGPFCAWTCAIESDCRDGYRCITVSANEKACLPQFLVPPIGEPSDYPFPLICGVRSNNGVVNVDFTVARATRSYTITALARDGINLQPRGLILPSGGSVDFTGDHLFQALTAELQGWIAPFTIPMVEQDEALKEAGMHRLVFDSASQDVCWYLIEESTPGTKIDFEIYFVGVDGLDARSAPRDQGFQQMLTELDRIYGQVGLNVGRVRYHDVTRDVDRFSVLSSEADFYELMAKSVAPMSSELDEHMTVNVFFVKTITIGALGISSAIGGPPALHGTTASGVVATAEFLNMDVPSPWTGETVDGDLLTSIIVAHEVGHFLNLWHTSDVDGSNDPVLDTAECAPDVPPDECGAFGNVMYSAGVGSELTPGQGYSVQAHVLSKE